MGEHTLIARREFYDFKSRGKGLGKPGGNKRRRFVK